MTFTHSCLNEYTIFSSFYSECQNIIYYRDLRKAKNYYGLTWVVRNAVYTEFYYCAPHGSVHGRSIKFTR